jgi:hypothetical protein
MHGRRRVALVHQQDPCHSAKKSRARKRGFEVSNREASNRVTGVTRRNPVKDYKKTP